MRKAVKKIENTMTYRFREVKCPWCDHVFMWSRDGREGPFLWQYMLRVTGKPVETATCPMCGNEVAVLEGIFEAINVVDDRIVDTFRDKQKQG